DPQIVVEAVKQFLAADQFDDLAAKTAENPGELDRDIAAADDDDLARQTGQIECLVRRDHMLDARDVRRGRVPAGGDQDVVGGVAPAGDLDRVRVDQGAAPLGELEPAGRPRVDVA